MKRSVKQKNASIGLVLTTSIIDSMQALLSVDRLIVVASNSFNKLKDMLGYGTIAIHMGQLVVKM